MNELSFFTPIMRDRPKYQDPSRRTGRTTRLVNDAIDRLFKRGRTAVCDHHCESGYTWTQTGSKHMMDLFFNRLSRDHGVSCPEHIRKTYIKDGTWYIEFKQGNYYFHN